MEFYMMRSIVSVLFCFIALQIPAFAQNAPGVHWKQLETRHFIIIYPEQIALDASRVADTMENIYPFEHKTIGSGSRHPGKTRLLLFTQYAESNGISTILPRRTEWYNAPPQTSFSGVFDWYQMLGLHEYRHLLQFDSLTTGLVYGMYCLFGETGQAIGLATVPTWYYEGDAVMTETLLSDAGRGRAPSFDAELRALLLNGSRYSYYKAMLGSYTDHDPLSSPYLLGYFMTGAARSYYKPQMLESVKQKRGWLPFIPYNFDLAMGIQTGIFPSDLYNRVMDDMTARWKKQISNLPITPAPTIVPAGTGWTVNKSPHYLDNLTFVTVHSTTTDPTHIALFDTGAKESVLAQSYPAESLISTGGGKVVWAETIPDIRWTMRSFSDVFISDGRGSSPRRLTYRQRYYAPAISADGTTIATVEFGEDNICSLIILDAKTGEVRRRIITPDNEFIQTPSFTPDGQTIIFCSTDAVKGKALKKFTIADGATGIDYVIQPGKI